MMLMGKEYWLLGGALIAVITAVFGIKLFQGRQSQPPPLAPHAFVTTFKDSPQTSRAFTWQTVDPDAATVIQVIKGSGVTDFEREDVITVTATTFRMDTGSGLKGVHKVHVTGLEPGTRLFLPGGKRRGERLEPTGGV